jgi:hypothetical protein
MTKAHSAEAIEILDDLGGYIRNLSALLRAATFIGTTNQDDEMRLVDMALEYAESAERRYLGLCGVSARIRQFTDSAQ